MIYKFTVLILLFCCSAVYPAEGDYYKQAVNKYLDGEIEEAMELLEKTCRYDPDNKAAKNLYTETVILVAGKYYENAEYKKAFELIEIAKKVKPDDDKVKKVYQLLDEKLHPEKYTAKKPKEINRSFEKIHDNEKNIRKARVNIIKKPASDISKSEQELIRPLFIESGGGSSLDIKFIVIVIIFGVVLLVAITGYWVKQIMIINQKNIIELSKITDQKVEKLEKELEKTRKDQKRSEEQAAKRMEKEQKSLKLMEEKLRKKYSPLKDSSRSGMTAVRAVPEPEIMQEITVEDDRKKKNTIESFRSLKKAKYNNAVILVEKLSRHPNPWYRIWASELANELKAAECIRILDTLAKDEEYKVKKSSLKILKSLRESGLIDHEQLKKINTVIKASLQEGWIM